MVLERQVADDHLPARGLRQLGLEPAPLRRGLRLTLHREELAVPAVAERTGVEHQHADIDRGEVVGVIARGHDPAALRPARVIQLGLRGHIVVVIAEGGDPGHLERRRDVDFLEGCPPTRVVRRTNAVRIEIVARREDRGDRRLRGARSHRLGHGPLEVGITAHQGILLLHVRIGPAPVAQHEGAQRSRFGGTSRQGEQAEREETRHPAKLTNSRETASPCPTRTLPPTCGHAPAARPPSGPLGPFR